MKRAIVIFCLFVMVSIIASGVALLFGNYSALAAGVPLRELKVSAVASGVSLFVMEFLLSVGLVWYFSWADKGVRMALKDVVPVCAPKLIGSILGLLLLSVGLSIALGPLHLSDGGSTLLFGEMKHNALCMLLLCVVGPVTEELVFRRGILLGLLKHGIPPVWALAVSTLLFALIHGNFAQGAVALIGGAFLGLAFLHTGNLRLSVPLHIANNTLAVVLMYFPSIEASFELLPPVVSIALGLLVAVLGAFLMLTAAPVKTNAIPLFVNVTRPK